jgi:GNAT superfamily N-acetyltransferase
MRSSVRVTAVEGRADGARFVDLPYRLYRSDPHWVPPLRRMERLRWSAAHNPTLRDRTVARFLAWRGDRVVGRVAAVLDPAFAERWCPGAGLFGFFEVERDPGAGEALLEAAEEWLAARDVRTVLGPVNLSTHDEVGFLVDGFDRRPTVLSPYNPRHYPEMVEKRGYGTAREYEAFLWLPEKGPSPAVERLLRRYGAGVDSGGLSVRAFDPGRWDDEVGLLRRLYNGCFRDLWGFVAMSDAEFRARAADFRAFYDPDLVLIAEREGTEVGFMLVLPDIHEALVHARGRLLPFGWLRLARAVRRIRTVRVVLLGVLPDHHGRGIAPLLAGEAARIVRGRGIRSGELSLIQAGNEPMLHVVEAFGCPRVRRFRLYRRDL